MHLRKIINIIHNKERSKQLQESDFLDCNVSYKMLSPRAKLVVFTYLIKKTGKTYWDARYIVHCFLIINDQWFLLVPMNIHVKYKYSASNIHEMLSKLQFTLHPPLQPKTPWNDKELKRKNYSNIKSYLKIIEENTDPFLPYYITRYDKDRFIWLFTDELKKYALNLKDLIDFKMHT